MFYTVEEFLKNNEDLDYRMIDFLNENSRCECGHLHLINETMTSFICSSSTCKFAASVRLLQMLRDLGYKGIGKETCNKLCEAYDFTNPLHLFSYDIDTDGVLLETMSFDKCFELYTFLQNIELPLWRYLYISNIGIRDNAVKLLGDFRSFKEFFESLESADSPILWISQRLGHLNIGVNDIKLYEILKEFKDSFLEIEQYLKIEQKSKLITVVISNELKNWNNKDQFVKVMSSKYNIDIHRADSVSSSIFCLITEDKNANTRKIENAKKKGLPIYTSMEFEEVLKQGI